MWIAVLGFIHKEDHLPEAHLESMEEVQVA